MKKIALEEHFMVPEFVDYFRTTQVNISHELADRAIVALSDFGGQRLEQMDANGVDFAVLSLAGPGAQVEPDRGLAERRTRALNDFLAGEIAKRPNRYGGLGHLAMHDGASAADEMERCVGQLGFAGVMINGQTNGEYLDADKYEPFWERAAALGAPVYIHPANPVDKPAMYAGHSELWGPVWSWGVETGTHALRLVFAGVFERHPGATLILGHMGEAIPFQLWRIDGRWEIANRGGRSLPKPPSHYIKSNIAVTMSGVFSREPLYCALSALGEDRVMFSADYPFERMKLAADFIDGVPLEESLRAKLCRGNAERILKLAP